MLLRKERSEVEVYNDLDGDVVGLFRTLRNSARARELIVKLWLTPFSRTEHDESFEETSESVESARRLVFRSSASFGSKGGNLNNTRIGFRWQPARAYAREFSNKIPALLAAADRLRGVTIENQDAFSVIKQQDSKETLFYLDPPYTPESCTNAAADYRHSFSDQKHVDLAKLLARVSGKVILSGYPNPLYERLYADWRSEKTSHFAVTKKGAAKRTECVWMNF